MNAMRTGPQIRSAGLLTDCSVQGGDRPSAMHQLSSKAILLKIRRGAVPSAALVVFHLAPGYASVGRI
jgi:hypothetical protein